MTYLHVCILQKGGETHTHTHACTHAHTRARTETHAQTHSHTQTRAQTHAYAEHTRTHKHTRIGRRQQRKRTPSALFIIHLLLWPVLVSRVVMLGCVSVCECVCVCVCVTSARCGKALLAVLCQRHGDALKEWVLF